MVHYFYFQEQSAADEAASELQVLGCIVEVRRGALGGNWLVRAEFDEMHDKDWTEQFEKLAERWGGEYDGWEKKLGS